MMHGILITGTDTGVGKTVVTSLLARQLRAAGRSVGIYKPACSGAEQSRSDGSYLWPDLEQLSFALDHQFPREWICPQKFLAPLAPPAAAALEKTTVDRDLLRTGVDVWRKEVEVLLVEGVGGWLCPLTDHETVADLAKDLGFPILVVAANRLGMINHTLLTLQSVRFFGCRLGCAVVNNASAEDDGTGATNALILSRLAETSIFGPLPWQPKLDTEIDHDTSRVLNAVMHQLSSDLYLPAIQT